MIQDMVRMVLRLAGQKTESPYSPEQLLRLRTEDMPPFPERLQVLLDQGQINRLKTCFLKIPIFQTFASSPWFWPFTSI